MPGIVALRDAISAHVVAALATAGYPALVDGKILLGRQTVFEHSAPPRIIFVPMSSDFSVDNMTGAATPTAGYTAEQLLQLKNRSIATDAITFEVRCWGASVSNDPATSPDDDYDRTQTLYQQVIRSCDHLARGTFSVGKGVWTDASYGSAQLIRDGREFVFSLSFGTPIQELLAALLSPTNVTMQETDKLKLRTGEEEAGCSSVP